jgi:isoleucyl-tRNA synthetase
VTPELRREGLAREVIRLVQDARKADGLEVSDRIALRWEATDPELAAALTEHEQLIAGEVLATEFGTGGAGQAAVPDAGTEHRAADLGLAFWIRRS